MLGFSQAAYRTTSRLGADEKKYKTLFPAMRTAFQTVHEGERRELFLVPCAGPRAPRALWLQAGLRGEAPGKGPADVESVAATFILFLLIFMGGPIALQVPDLL